jgi:hypothetical protein
VSRQNKQVKMALIAAQIRALHKQGKRASRSAHGRKRASTFNSPDRLKARVAIVARARCD